MEQKIVGDCRVPKSLPVVYIPVLKDGLKMGNDKIMYFLEGINDEEIEALAGVMKKLNANSDWDEQIQIERWKIVNGAAGGIAITFYKTDTPVIEMSFVIAIREIAGQPLSKIHVEIFYPNSYMLTRQRVAGSPLFGSLPASRRKGT